MQSHITRRLGDMGFDDLSEAHMAVFIHIDHDRKGGEHDGSRLTTLAQRAQMTLQSMGYLVDNLEARGYVERVPDPVDGRAKLIRLTQRGWQLHDAADRVGPELEADWEARMGPARYARLRALLEELAQAL
ncbi:MAG: MarR family transcriptional regulator [Candidatus Dormiibacterota bacterium]